jgi:transposase
MYVLQSGCQWRLLPLEFGKKSTVHGTFMRWVRAGIFQKIVEKMAQSYEESRGRFGIWYAIDTSSCKAPFASTWGGKNPTDRAKFGVKKHIIIDQRGAPMAISVGPANEHDSKHFAQALAQFRLYDPNQLKIIAADSAYDSRKIRDLCRKNNFILLAATNKRNTKKFVDFIKPSHRWLVERTLSWLNWLRGLKTCWAKNKNSFLAFCQLACSIQLFRMSRISG